MEKESVLDSSGIECMPRCGAGIRGGWHGQKLKAWWTFSSQSRFPSLQLSNSSPVPFNLFEEFRSDAVIERATFGKGQSPPPISGQVYLSRFLRLPPPRLSNSRIDPFFSLNLSIPSQHERTQTTERKHKKDIHFGARKFVLKA